MTRRRPVPVPVPVLSLTWLRRRGACDEGIRFARVWFGTRPRRLSRWMLEQLLGAGRLTFFWWLVERLAHRRPALQTALDAIGAAWDQRRSGAEIVNAMCRTHDQPLHQDVWVAALGKIDQKRRRATVDAIAEYFNL